MKRGTLEHLKTLRLAVLLSAERPTDQPDALGIVEALCNHVAPDCAPQGDIGRCTNVELAKLLLTSRDPDLLVRAMVQAGWLEEHAEYRLLIHDWPEHADDGVKKKLLRKGLPFLTASGPCPVRLSMASGHGRDEGAMASRHRRDNGGPPRAGTGTGTGSGSSALPEEAKNPETNGRARARRQKLPRAPMPKGFALDAELTEVLREAGCRNPAQGFAAFAAYHRREGSLFVDWRAAVRTWAGNHERFGCPCQGRESKNGKPPEPHYPDLTDELRRLRERDAAQQRKASA